VSRMSIFSRLFGDTSPAEETPLPYDPASPEGLAARWVRWVAGVEYEHSPVADRTGEDAGRNQPDDVWFLAGCFGGVVERRCAVPAYRPLFFPAFNMWHYPASGPPPAMPHAFGEVIVDGQAVPAGVIATPVPFQVTGVRSNPVTQTRRPIRVTVWGLWTRLEPLSPGEHVIGFHGGDGHGFTVTATYVLNVSP
jgi:hypothetical protein